MTHLNILINRQRLIVVSLGTPALMSVLYFAITVLLDILSLCLILLTIHANRNENMECFFFLFQAKTTTTIADQRIWQIRRTNNKFSTVEKVTGWKWELNFFSFSFLSGQPTWLFYLITRLQPPLLLHSFLQIVWCWLRN